MILAILPKNVDLGASDPGRLISHTAVVHICAAALPTQSLAVCRYRAMLGSDIWQRDAQGYARVHGARSNRKFSLFHPKTIINGEYSLPSVRACQYHYGWLNVIID